jgi:hypothetical protein
MMNQDEKRSYVGQLIDSGNYLAAIICIKELQEDYLKAELMGKMVNRITDEMNTYTTRRNQEKILYLRSLLMWIFRDFPHLGRIYREQLNAVQQPSNPFNLLNGLKTLGSASLDQKEMAENIEDTVDSIKQNFEDATESVKNGEVEDKINDFFNMAGDGIRKGLKGLSDFFGNMNRQPDEQAPDKTQAPEGTDKKEPERKDDPSN